MNRHICSIYETDELGDENYDVHTKYYGADLDPVGISFQNYGSAITTCLEDDNGALFVTNNEYASQVNYCPYCGYKAKIQIMRE